MGLIRGGVPTELAIALKNAYNLQGFIETDTNCGATALWLHLRDGSQPRHLQAQ
jgi:hypothetical protein